MIPPGFDRLQLVFDTSRRSGDWETIHAALSVRAGGRIPRESQVARIVSSRWEEVPFHIRFEVWLYSDELHWHVEVRRNPAEEPPEFVLRRSHRVGWFEGFSQWLANLCGDVLPDATYEAAFKFPRSNHTNVFGLPSDSPWPGISGGPAAAKLTSLGFKIGKTRVTCEADPDSDFLLLRVSDMLIDSISHAVERTLKRALDALQPYVRETSHGQAS